MHLRYRSVLLLVAICTALAAAPAFAAKPSPTAGPTPSNVLGHIGPTSSGAVPCQLGITAPPVAAFGYILPPDDEYMILMDPSTCGPCPGGAFKATTAHIVLLFTDPCQIPVTVDLVAAVNNGGCYQPNPFAPLCTPVQYLIDDGGLAGQGICVDYGLPLGQDCCFQGPAFVRFRFDQGSCANSRPAFCSPASCSNCTEYNYYPGASFPGDDLCAVLSPFGFFGIIAYADVSCCNPTPTLPGSWGKVKTIYR